MFSEVRLVICVTILPAFLAYGQLYRPVGTYSSCQQLGHIALTFDDGPSNYTEGFLDVLYRYDVKATFFIWGEKLNTSVSQNALKRMQRDGHVIGSHTYTHTDLSTLPSYKIEQEMAQTQRDIYFITGLKPALMRPPYGVVNDAIFNQLKSLGYEVILWNIDTQDWRVREFNPSLLYEEYQYYFGNSTAYDTHWITLHHDVYAETLEYLPKIIEYVRKIGYKIVDIKTCLGLERVYMNA